MYSSQGQQVKFNVPGHLRGSNEAFILHSVKEEDQKSTGKTSRVNFVDINDPTKVVNQIDIDNVVLSFRQQLRLCA